MCGTFSQLYNVMQHREGDMAIKHENHPYPLIGEEWSQICLVFYLQKQKSVAFDVKVLDSAAIVHLLSTNGVSTFDNYASGVFIPYIKK